MPIKLIVGLGNPGDRYAKTRHNVGANFVKTIAERYNEKFKTSARHRGAFTTIQVTDDICHLFIPDTFMNVCGMPIRSFMAFYKIWPSSLLVAYDELDFPPGIVRLKRNGGDAGHKGLQDIKRYLRTGTFWRLRFGIGHPGHASAVPNYVLKKPTVFEQADIDRAMESAFLQIADLVKGDTERVMRCLHTAKG